jgi:anaerobic selenocysteine-containing dehydrogenase
VGAADAVRARPGVRLQQAAPEAWVELSAADAAGLGVADGDRVRVASRRGAIVAAARVTGIADGMVFVPFHYAPQAANELTLTAWDPVSKQPHSRRPPSA